MTCTQNSIQTFNSNGNMNCNNNGNRVRAVKRRRFNGLQSRTASLRPGLIGRPGHEANRIRGEGRAGSKARVRPLPVKARSQ